MKCIITPQEWIENWQANRRLTRRVIEAFPEKELFEFSVGGMRPFAHIADELLHAIDINLNQIVGKQVVEYQDYTAYVGYAGNTKAEILANWDKATAKIDDLMNEFPQEQYREQINLQGEFEMSVIGILTYQLQNEIHHRGQGYVYLRVLGIEPPGFYDVY